MSEEAGPVFADFIAEELKAERERRTTLDQRGIVTVTSSGVLVALASGLTALAAGKPGDLRPNDLALAFVITSILGFALAGFLGILANRSLGYVVLSVESLSSLREQSTWSKSADDGRWLISGVKIKTIETLRKANERKSALVNYALTAQLAAIVSLIGAIIVTLMS